MTALTRNRFRKGIPGALLAFILAGTGALSGQETVPGRIIELPAFTVGEGRTLPFAASNAPTGPSLSLADLQQRPPLTVDERLREIPAFSTFRQTASQAAHPTSQGVRLRGMGTSGASRALVTLDGVPLNDPFGGWVYWDALPIDSVRRIQINTTAGGEAWGNLGAGGTIAIQTRGAGDEHTFASVLGGTDETIRVQAGRASFIAPTLAVAAHAGYFETEGFHTVPAFQRGPIDRPSGTRSLAARAELLADIGTDWTLIARVNGFREEKGNGTPQAINQTEGIDGSVQLKRSWQGGERQLLVNAYGQDRTFRNVFTALDEAREIERPVLDQFSIPSTALGGSIEFFNTLSSGSSYLVGLDARWLEGTVNERFRNLGSGFTRLREAGGEQFFAGSFVTLRGEPWQDAELRATLRLDRAGTYAGFRREFDTSTGQALRGDEPGSEFGWEPSLAITLTQELTDFWTLTAHASHGFRTPTLNEFYRPFRVANDIVEANAKLANESITQGELRLAYADPSDGGFRVEAAFFAYHLDDMVTNVLLTTESGPHPLCGFIPEGGSCSQRLNVGGSSLWGIELSARYEPVPGLIGGLDYLWTHTGLGKADSAFSLDGNEFPLTPEHSATARIDWSPREEDWSFWTVVRYHSRQYDDATNLRPLSSALWADIGARYSISNQISLTAEVANVADTRVQTGLASDGEINNGTPRSFWLSLRYQL